LGNDFIIVLNYDDDGEIQMLELTRSDLKNYMRSHGVVGPITLQDVRKTLKDIVNSLRSGLPATSQEIEQYIGVDIE
jgi:hypothetical protein